MDNITIKEVQCIKFLGVILDCKLTWTNHITEIENKISKNIGVILRARNCLKTKELQTLYCSLILLYLDYGVVLWGNNYKSRLNRIIKLQKRVIRVIAKVDYGCCTLPLFENMGLLKFTDIVFKNTAVVMYKVTNEDVHLHLVSLFKTFSTSHHYKTRQNDDYCYPKYKTNLNKFSFRVIECKI